MAVAGGALDGLYYANHIFKEIELDRYLTIKFDSRGDLVPASDFS